MTDRLAVRACKILERRMRAALAFELNSSGDQHAIKPRSLGEAAPEGSQPDGAVTYYHEDEADPVFQLTLGLF